MAMFLPHNRPRCAVLLLAMLFLAGCVDSAAPLLTGAQPTRRIHGYAFKEGRASEQPAVGNFRWDGTQYRVVGRPTVDATAGDDPIVQNRLAPIIQTRTAQPDLGIEYALARKLSDGVYSLSAIDETDADEATGTKFCTRHPGSACRLETSEARLAIIVGNRKYA